MSITYDLIQINEAINNPKSDKAHAVAEGWGIDSLLVYCKNSLSEDDLPNAEIIIEKIREYVKRNLQSKFETKKYARELVSNLKKILGIKF